MGFKIFIDLSSKAAELSNAMTVKARKRVRSAREFVVNPRDASAPVGQQTLRALPGHFGFEGNAACRRALHGATCGPPTASRPSRRLRRVRVPRRAHTRRATRCHMALVHETIVLGRIPKHCEVMAGGACYHKQVPDQVAIPQPRIGCKKDYTGCVRQASCKQPEKARCWHSGKQRIDRDHNDGWAALS